MVYRSVEHDRDHVARPKDLIAIPRVLDAEAHDVWGREGSELPLHLQHRVSRGRGARTVAQVAGVAIGVEIDPIAARLDEGPAPVRLGDVEHRDRAHVVVAIGRRRGAAQLDARKVRLGQAREGGRGLQDRDAQRRILFDPLAAVIVADRQAEPEQVVHPLLPAFGIALASIRRHVEGDSEHITRAVRGVAVVGVGANEGRDRRRQLVAKVAHEQRDDAVHRIVATARAPERTALRRVVGAAAAVTHNGARAHSGEPDQHVAVARRLDDRHHERGVVGPRRTHIRAQRRADVEHVVRAHARARRRLRGHRRPRVHGEAARVARVRCESSAAAAAVGRQVKRDCERVAAAVHRIAIVEIVRGKRDDHGPTCLAIISRERWAGRKGPGRRARASSNGGGVLWLDRRAADWIGHRRAAWARGLEDRDAEH